MAQDRMFWATTPERCTGSTATESRAHRSTASEALIQARIVADLAPRRRSALVTLRCRSWSLVRARDPPFGADILSMAIKAWLAQTWAFGAPWCWWPGRTAVRPVRLSWRERSGVGSGRYLSAVPADLLLQVFVL